MTPGRPPAPERLSLRILLLVGFAGIFALWLASSYDLVSLLAIKCVDIPDSSTANGVVAQIWECGGTPNQKWTY